MMWLSFLAFGTIGFWVVLFLSAILVSSLVDEDRFGAATLVAIATFCLLALLGDFNPIEVVRAHPTEALLAIPAYFGVGIAWAGMKWSLFTGQVRRKLDAVAAKFKAMVTEHEAHLADAAELHTATIARLEAEKQRLRDNPDGASGDQNWMRGHRGPGQAVHDLDNSIHQAKSQLDQNAARVELIASEKWRREQWSNLMRDTGISFTVDPRISLNQHKTRILSWMMYWPASMAWTVVNDPVRRAFHAIYDHLGGWFQGIADRRLGDVATTYKSALDR